MISADQHTLREIDIEVGGGHTLSTQLWGNERQENPFVFLHGGPGSGCKDRHKEIFDPVTHKVLFIDQRGCGQSTPRGSIINNTTDLLVEDISKVADKHGLDQFAVIGNSWGSCLGLIYAIRNATRVSRLVIGGVFTSRKEEIDYLYLGGFRDFFPTLWEDFIRTVPEESQESAGYYHVNQCLGADPKVAKASAYAIAALGNVLSSTDERVPEIPFDEFDPMPTIIQAHYDANQGFIPENYVVTNLEFLKIPVDIIQGRYDMICPPKTAHQVAERLADARLTITPAGHSMLEPPNLEAFKKVVSQ